MVDLFRWGCDSAIEGPGVGKIGRGEGMYVNLNP
jgi:hypothetical protein